MNNNYKEMLSTETIDQSMEFLKRPQTTSTNPALTIRKKLMMINSS